MSDLRAVALVIGAPAERSRCPQILERVVCSKEDVVRAECEQRTEQRREVADSLVVM